MADGEENCSIETSLKAKHAAERKELQSKTQQLKRSIPKGDKKKKKEVAAQIALLEAELEQRHELELEGEQDQVSNITEKVDALTTEETANECKVSPPGAQNAKMSKAQKRRDKKALQEKEREERIKQAEIDNVFGPRNVEIRKIKEILGKKDLQIYQIASDGNCLYSAIEHQLNNQGVQCSMENLRLQTGEHMRKHTDDFLPFLCKPHTGEPYSPEEYEQYCTELETTPAWGGQLEIRALSNVLEVPIEVVQADSPCVVLGEEFKKDPLILLYHRHMYGLGEHYNSVAPKVDDEEDDFNEQKS